MCPGLYHETHRTGLGLASRYRLWCGTETPERGEARAPTSPAALGRVQIKQPGRGWEPGQPSPRTQHCLTLCWCHQPRSSTQGVGSCSDHRRQQSPQGWGTQGWPGHRLWGQRSQVLPRPCVLQSQLCPCTVLGLVLATPS